MLILILIFPTLFLLSRFVATRYSNYFVKSFLFLVENLVGILFIMLSVTAFFDILDNFVSILNTGFIIVYLSLFFIVIGAINAKILRVKKINLKSKKIKSNKKVVLLSDIHVGSNSKNFLRSIVNKVNELEPDFVLITGDLIDERFVDFNDIKIIDEIKSKVFFVYGNHEFYVGDEYVSKIFSKTNMIVLRNSSKVLDDIQIIGIDDGYGKITLKKELAKIDLKNSKYKILMYHRPKGYKFASKEGVDLMVSGHTHAGQIIPFNFVVKLFFRKMIGLYKVGSMNLYINPGTGVWGPKIRLSSRCEITQINLLKE
jgi:hypothetical protein